MTELFDTQYQSILLILIYIQTANNNQQQDIFIERITYVAMIWSVDSSEWLSDWIVWHHRSEN